MRTVGPVSMRTLYIEPDAAPFMPSGHCAVIEISSLLRELILAMGEQPVDARPAGVKYAVLERCPVFEGKVKTFDATKAKAVAGVKDVFSIGHGVAVVAENTWAAMQGRKQLVITWDEGPRAGNSTAGLRAAWAKQAETPGQQVQNAGNVDTALAGAAKKIEAVYEAPYLSHAPMEPLNATVLVTDLARLQFLFQPTGTAFADSVGVRGPAGTVMVTVDPWNGMPRADAR